MNSNEKAAEKFQGFNSTSFSDKHRGVIGLIGLEDGASRIYGISRDGRAVNST